jgi:hypothetical protein
MRLETSFRDSGRSVVEIELVLPLFNGQFVVVL